MPDIDAIQRDIATGIRSGLTWQNIGEQLAKGAVSGLASFAIGELLGYITNELTNPITLENVIAAFEQQIAQAVQDIENYLDEARLADQVTAKLAADTEIFPTYAAS